MCMSVFGMDTQKLLAAVPGNFPTGSFSMVN